MNGPRRPRGDLPHAPLLMVHPLAIPGAEVPGRNIVREVRTREGAILYALHWKVLSWSYVPENALGGEDRWGEVERETWSHPDEMLAEPLGRLAGCFARPHELREELVAGACLGIAEWALERDFRFTAADFARVAALAWPRNARYACVAGSVLRAVGEVRQAEWWFRRAHRIAVWTRDPEAQVRALVGWAEAGGERCCPAYAGRIYRRAIVLAERYGLAELKEQADGALQEVSLDPAVLARVRSFGVDRLC